MSRYPIGNGTTVVAIPFSARYIGESVPGVTTTQYFYIIVAYSSDNKPIATSALGVSAFGPYVIDGDHAIMLSWSAILGAAYYLIFKGVGSEPSISNSEQLFYKAGFSELGVLDVGYAEATRNSYLNPGAGPRTIGAGVGSVNGIAGDVTLVGGPNIQIDPLQPDGQSITIWAYPAGADTQVQFNQAGQFGASPQFVWTNNQLSVSGSININGDYPPGTPAPFPVGLFVNGGTILGINTNGTVQLSNLETVQVNGGYFIGSAPFAASNGAGGVNLSNIVNINGAPPGSGGGGGLPPGGTTGEIQFNAAGVFGASPNLSWDNTNQQMDIVGVTGEPTNIVTLSISDNATNSLQIGNSYNYGRGQGGAAWIQVVDNSGGTSDTALILQPLSSGAGFVENGVGIGVTSPTHMLDIAGDTCVTIGNYLVSYGNTPLISASAGQVLFAEFANATPPQGYAQGSANLSWDNTGNVLHVGGNVNVTGQYQVNGAPFTSGQMQTPWLSNINAASFNLDSVGFLGIGRASASNAMIAITGGANTGMMLNTTGTGIYMYNMTNIGVYAEGNSANNQPFQAVYSKNDNAAGSTIVSLNTSGGYAFNIGVTGASWTQNPFGAITAFIQSPSSGDLRILMGNTLAIAAIQSGFVGIGVNPPAYKLDIAGDCNITGTYRVNGTPLATGGGGFWQGGSGGAIYYNGGNVGIGNSNPISFGAAYPVLTLGPSTSGTTGQGIFIGCTYTTVSGGDVAAFAGANYAITPGDQRIAQVVIRTDSATGNSGAILFETGVAGSVTERMRITSTGNVGIGTSSPTNTLSVVGPNGGAVANFPLQWSCVNNVLGYLGADPVSYFSGALYLYQNGSPNTVISAGANNPSYFMGGNVGIGTSSPTCNLDVAGLIRSSALGTAPPTGTGPGIEVFYNAGSGYVQSISRNPSGYMPLGFLGNPISFTGGNVGIGTTSPSGKFVSSIDSNSQSDPSWAVVGQSSSVPAKRTGMGYDANIDAGFVQSTNSGVGPRPLVLNYAGGNVGIGSIPSPQGVLHVNGGGNQSWAYFVLNPNMAFPANVGSGLGLTWNFSGGQAEVNFFNMYIGALPNPSYRWHQLLTASSQRPLMDLDGNGNLNVYGGYKVNGNPIAFNGVSVQTEPGRSNNVTYQNTTGKPMFVSAMFALGSGQTANGYVDSGNPPSTYVSNISGPGTFNITMWVLNGFFYLINASVAPSHWTEWY